MITKGDIHINLVQSLEVLNLTQAYTQFPESSSDEATLEDEDSGFLEKFASDDNSLHGDSPVQC